MAFPSRAMSILAFTICITSAAPSVSDNSAGVAQDLAQRIATIARASTAPWFMVALSGGSALDMLAKGLLPLKDDKTLRWETWRVFLVDERCVTTDDAHSNFGALTRFAEPLPLESTQLFPGAAMIDSALAAGGCKQLAHDYAGQLRGFVMPPDVPRFEVVVLGTGPDGHTASLFPGSPTGQDHELVLQVSDSPKPPADRVTLSLPLINGANHVLVAAVGSSKQSALAHALCEQDSALPLALVAPTHGEVDFLFDRAAAPPCMRGVHMVWFGSSGSLAKKYTWKMLQNLFRKGAMKNALVHAVGSKAYKQGLELAVSLAHQKAHCGDLQPEACKAQVDAFLQQLSYVQLTRTKDPKEIATQFQTLNTTINSLAVQRADPLLWPLHSASPAASPRVVFYLSTPPSAYVATIKSSCIHVLGPRPWPVGTSFLIEKPFGFDLADVRARQTSYSEAGVEEAELWRLDHYLGKSGVRNMLLFRQQNPEWEKEWNGEHINTIEIVVQETENVNDRVDYYGESGAVRDMMVNHLMAIVATAGMTSLPKDALDAGAKRAAFVRQLLPVSRDSLYLGQYEGYKEALAAHYAKEPQSRKVDKAELAPTAALAIMKSSDPHWAGTQFVLAHTKASDTRWVHLRSSHCPVTSVCGLRRAHARVLFKDGTELTFHIQGGGTDEFVAMSTPDRLVRAEAPFTLGSGWEMTQASVDPPNNGLWVAEPLSKSLNAYEALYGDALKGDKSHFVSFPEVEAAYQVWDQVLDFTVQPKRYAEGSTVNQVFIDAGAAALSEPPKWPPHWESEVPQQDEV